MTMKKSVPYLLSVYALAACSGLWAQISKPFLCPKPDKSTQIALPCDTELLSLYDTQIKVSINAWTGFLSLRPIKTSGAEIKSFEEAVVQDRHRLDLLSEPLPMEPADPFIFLDENQENRYKDFRKNEGRKIAELAKSVGRLEIKYTSETGPPVRYAQWGTAFAVGPDIIATSCHALESMVAKDSQGNWKLVLDKDEKLIIDFDDRDDQFEPGREYAVDQVFWLPEEEGMDIAFLTLKDEGKSRPPAVKIGKVKATTGPDDRREIAVVGYPDFHHFLDPYAAEAFEPYRFEGDAKFVSLGCALNESEASSCKGETGSQRRVLHTATTTMGESGSIVIDRKNQFVIGMHNCCSFPQKEDGHAPKGDLACARLKRTVENQYISLCDVLQDPGLQRELNSKHIKLDPLGACSTTRD